MDFLLIAVLTMLNGLFAMSEMAVATSRKARLTALAEAGNHGAQVALELQEQPTRFLSTVQVGITSTGILNGIVGEAAFSASVAEVLRVWGLGDRVAGMTATGLVVAGITFVTIVFGELVPKRIGQMFPESVACWVSPPMKGLASMASPFVKLLSSTTVGLLGLMRLNRPNGPVVTEEEIAASLAEGVSAGLIEAHEHQMVRNVFHLDDRAVTSLMTPRSDIRYFDAQASIRQCLEQIGLTTDHQQGHSGGHSWYPVCKGSLDEVIGVVSVNRLVESMVSGLQENRTTQVRQLVSPVVFVPESLSGAELLEQFRTQNVRLVLVVDEYGGVQGLLTAHDLLEGIAGELKAATQDQSWAVSQSDGTWLLDGMMPVAELKARLSIKTLPHEDKARYNTLAGLLMSVTGQLPAAGAIVVVSGWEFRVIKLSGRRIEQIVARRVVDQSDTDSTGVTE